MAELIELLRNYRWLIIVVACLSEIGLIATAVQIYREAKPTEILSYDWHGRVIKRGLRL